MKLGVKIFLLSLLSIKTIPALADSDLQTLLKDFQNFGGFLGYDVTADPKADSRTVTQAILDLPAAQLAQSVLISTFFGAIPVVALSTSAAETFVPTSESTLKAINDFANATFKNYSTPPSNAASGNMVGVNPLIDQQPYQGDPVSQSVLNVLSTPDITYCMYKDKPEFIPSSGSNQKCKYLYETLVSAQVIGTTIPEPRDFFNSDYTQNFLNQLNSNALTAPLMYSNEQSAAPKSGSKYSSSGLNAQNQAQAAANFIRYVSGEVTPVQLARWGDYDAWYNDSQSDKNITKQNIATSIITTYLTKLRTFAAQNSVGLSNLYFILSKRLPQTGSKSNSQSAVSQAVTEYTMATRRLPQPSSTSTDKNQWINQINEASAATVQKEIAVLLSEINYQLYLDRQIQERILLTNSILLLQKTKETQPNLPPKPNDSSKSLYYKD